MYDLVKAQNKQERTRLLRWAVSAEARTRGRGRRHSNALTPPVLLAQVKAPVVEALNTKKGSTGRLRAACRRRRADARDKPRGESIGKEVKITSFVLCVLLAAVRCVSNMLNAHSDRSVCIYMFMLCGFQVASTFYHLIFLQCRKMQLKLCPSSKNYLHVKVF